MSEFGGGDGSAADGSGFDHGSHDHHHHHGDGSAFGADGGAMDFQELTEASDLSAQVDHNPFKSVKLSDVFKGITITPNFMLAMMFVGFTVWLFVIYWIRHNEPLANQVLGSPTHGAPLADHDRAIVKGARNALPFLPNPRTEFYTPDKRLRDQTQSPSGLPPLPSLGDPSAFSQQSAAAFTHNAAPHHQPGSAISAPTYFGSPDQEVRVLKGGRDHTVIPHPEPMQAAPIMPVPQYSHHQFQPAVPLAQQTYGAMPQNQQAYGAMPQQPYGAMPQQGYGAQTPLAGAGYPQQMAPQPMPFNQTLNIGGRVYQPSQGGTRLKMVVNR